MKISNPFLMLAATAVMLSSCGGGSSTNDAEGETSSTTTELTGEVKIDGSSTVFPITEAIAEEFNNENPKVKVTIGVSGTGGGFKKFARGETDINDASRPIKEKEKTACTENGITCLQLTVAFDGIAVLANPENDWLENITVEELKMIWEPAAQTTITHWNQIRVEWPAEEIHLYGPGVASGTFDYFTEALVGESGASRGDYTASEDDNILVQGIAQDKYALGFFGLAYYEENADKLKLIGVDPGTGAVKPTLETVKTGTYAPLSRPLFIYVSSTSAQRVDVQAFVNYYLENGAELSKDVGYIPLPADQYEKAQADFEAFSKPAQ
jgi:phosphate transport system substrate-binding protein